MLTDFGFYREGHPHYLAPRFSPDCRKIIYVGQTVIYLSLQLAYFMGFSEVYLIGMDHHYEFPKSMKTFLGEFTSMEDDSNHFHPDYFGKGKKWHDPQLDRVELAYAKAKQVFENAGRKVMNATVGGRLEIYPRVDYRSLFSRQ